MAEYIEREAALNVTCHNCSEKNICDGVCYDTDSIRSIPAADVQPVRHGRWIEVKGFTGVEAFGYREECVDGFACSVCGKEVDVSEGDFCYCPNCGAKMDKEDEESD